MDPQNQNNNYNPDAVGNNDEGFVPVGANGLTNNYSADQNVAPDYTPRFDPAMSDFSHNNVENVTEPYNQNSGNYYQPVYQQPQQPQSQQPQAENIYQAPLQQPVYQQQQGYQAPLQRPTYQQSEYHQSVQASQTEPGYGQYNSQVSQTAQVNDFAYQNNQNDFPPVGFQNPASEARVSQSAQAQSFEQPMYRANYQGYQPNMAQGEGQQFNEQISGVEQVAQPVYDYTSTNEPIDQMVYPNSNKKSHLSFWLSLVLVIVLLGAAVFAAWNYRDNIAELLGTVVNKPVVGSPLTELGGPEGEVENPITVRSEYLSATLFNVNNSPISEARIFVHNVDPYALDLDEISRSDSSGSFIVNRVVGINQCSVLRIEADGYFPVWRQTVSNDYEADSIVMNSLSAENVISGDFDQSLKSVYTINNTITFDFSQIQLQKMAGLLQSASTTLNAMYLSADDAEFMIKAVPIGRSRNTNYTVGVFAVEFVSDETNRRLMFSSDSLVPITLTIPRNTPELVLLKFNDCNGEWERYGVLSGSSGVYQGVIFAPGWYRIDDIIVVEDLSSVLINVEAGGVLENIGTNDVGLFTIDIQTADALLAARQGGVAFNCQFRATTDETPARTVDIIYKQRNNGDTYTKVVDGDGTVMESLMLGQDFYTWGVSNGKEMAIKTSGSLMNQSASDSGQSNVVDNVFERRSETIIDIRCSALNENDSVFSAPNKNWMDINVIMQQAIMPQ